MKKKNKAESPAAGITPRAVISGINCWCRFDEQVDVVNLIENPRNPNKHPDKQIALLAKIIRHQGWRQPITVSKRSGFIVKGHGRLAAARVLNVENVPVEYQDYENEAAEMADLLADNRIAELAEVNTEEVYAILNEETFIDYDIELTGFDDRESMLEKVENDFSEDKPELEAFLEARKNARLRGDDKGEQNFWLCAVFQNYDQKMQFIEKVGISTDYGMYCDGVDLAKKLNIIVENNNMKPFSSNLNKKLTELIL